MSHYHTNLLENTTSAIYAACGSPYPKRIRTYKMRGVRTQIGKVTRTHWEYARRHNYIMYMYVHLWISFRYHLWQGGDLYCILHRYSLCGRSPDIYLHRVCRSTIEYFQAPFEHHAKYMYIYHTRVVTSTIDSPTQIWRYKRKGNSFSSCRRPKLDAMTGNPTLVEKLLNITVNYCLCKRERQINNHRLQS